MWGETGLGVGEEGVFCVGLGLGVVAEDEPGVTLELGIIGEGDVNLSENINFKLNVKLTNFK